MKLSQRKAALALCLVTGLTSGCLAVKVVDTAASAAIGVTKVAAGVAVKGVTTAAKVVTPDGDKKKKKK